jgi:hypothetical protein
MKCNHAKLRGSKQCRRCHLASLSRSKLSPQEVRERAWAARERRKLRWALEKPSPILALGLAIQQGYVGLARLPVKWDGKHRVLSATWEDQEFFLNLDSEARANPVSR